MAPDCVSKTDQPGTGQHSLPRVVHAAGGARLPGSGRHRGAGCDPRRGLPEDSQFLRPLTESTKKPHNGSIRSQFGSLSDVTIAHNMPARCCPLAFAPAIMAGAVLLLTTVPAGAQDAHGAIAFGQIT